MLHTMFYLFIIFLSLQTNEITDNILSEIIIFLQNYNKSSDSFT